MNEELRAVLVWLCERANQQVTTGYVAYCRTCGHELSADRIAGDADNPSPWPCDFPKIMGAPHALCLCTDYVPMSEEP